MTDTITDKPKSKYTITDIPGGFLVERDGGLQLGVTYGDTYLHVGGLGGRTSGSTEGSFAAPAPENVGLYCFPQMVNEIAEYFLEAQWTRYLRKNDRKTGTEMIARALSRRLKPHWERIIREFVPEEVAALARLMWSSVHGDARVLHVPDLYTDKYRHLRSDLHKYHACRLFARLWQTHYERNDLDVLLDWRAFFTPTVPYKALNKTLDKLPNAISFHDIERLRVMKLERPITNRLHLIFALVAAEHRHWGLHERAVLGGGASQIAEGAALFGFALKRQSKTAEIKRAANLILDYPHAYGGDLLGLARRSHEWHERADYSRSTTGPPPNHELPLLNLDYDLLAEEGVTPLRTVGDVEGEGSTMRHCVASYASHAAEGGCFLFHVEHNGEWATIEVSPAGKIRQAYGPRNTHNSACDWGVAMLRAAMPKEQIEVIQPVPF